MNNPWDKFTTIFGTVKSDKEITTTNADNILIAWPVILDFIKKFGKTEKGIHVLEYGCGTGSFAYILHKLGYDVTGIDSSEELIRSAKSAFNKDINFLTGDATLLSQFKPETFSIATSIMTFQFVEDIDKTFKTIANVLEPNGIFVFAVFNPTFIKECLRTKTFFENFDSFENPKVGIFSFDGNKIPVYIKAAEEYNKILGNLGFEPLLQSYPVFTEEFLRKYPISNLVNESEYLILGYKKM